jgi:hypothetical protein
MATKQESVEYTKTSLALPRELWSATKIHAIHEGLQFQEVVARALVEYLAKPSRRRTVDER